MPGGAEIYRGKKKDRAKAQSFLLFVFNNITEITIQSGADTIKNVTVISLDMIFIVVIDDLILDAGTFCQFITGDSCAFQGFIQS